MLREPPEMSKAEIRELMSRWLDDLEGIERLRRMMGPSTTMAEALAYYRAFSQSDRRPSKVMSESVPP